MDPRQEALAELVAALARTGYRFETVTPATHARVVGRPSMREARDLRGIFGWSLPFSPERIPARLLALARAAGVIVEDADRLRSTIRVSSLGPRLVAHSAYPTTERDAVFFGPDTIRFARLLDRACADRTFDRALDLGTGTGAGAIAVADRAREWVLSDVSERALWTAEANARAAGLAATYVRSDLFAAIEGEIDLAIANPPYLVDEARRTYRDGGGDRGIDLAVRIVREGLPRLRRGGRLVLYTGVPIVDGRDLLRAALDPLPPGARYEELDPDVFGEELDRAVYSDVERIAAIGLVIDA